MREFKYIVIVKYSAENRREYLFKTADEAEAFADGFEDPTIGVRVKEL